MRAVVFLELLGLPPSRAALAWKTAESWVPVHAPTATCRPGLSPHAPYSVHRILFFAAANRWRSRALPVAVHLAETTAELQFLDNHSGPFANFLESLGVWEPGGLARGLNDIMRLAKKAPRLLLIHGNYLAVDQPLPANVTIVHCPRTHAAFGHAPHPFRAFLQRGVRVALGTDSLASNPDLDVLAEARFLHQLYPDFPGAQLLRMATLAGAEALGWADETGSLTPGKSADLAVIPLADEDAADPYALLLTSPWPVAKTLFRGHWTAHALKGAS